MLTTLTRGKRFTKADLSRIASLDEHARKPGLKEVLASSFEGASLLEALFEMEASLRAGLRDLVPDLIVGPRATALLAFLGEPDDLAWLVERASAVENSITERGVAGMVVGAILQPRSEKEWLFIERCARGEYGDGDVPTGATRTCAVATLCLIGSARSRRTLEQLDMAHLDPAHKETFAAATAAVRFFQADSKVLSDRDLNLLASRLTTHVNTLRGMPNDGPYFNKKRDKAYIFIDSLIWCDVKGSATFRQVGGIWKLSGLFLEAPE